MQLKAIVSLLPKQSCTKGRHTYHQLRLRKCFQASSFLQKDDSDTSEDWIPPQRALSGDLGKSEVYATKTKAKQQHTGINKDILEMIREDQNVGETVEFFDLDDMDMDQLQKHLESQGGDLGNNTSISSMGDIKLDEDDVWEDVSGEDDDFDADEAFAKDEVLKELMDSLELDDEELLDLQMEMIEERLEEVKDDYKKGKTGEEASPQPSIDKFENFINEDTAELDEFLKQQNLESNESKTINDNIAPDWLSTRKSKLAPVDMLTPAESAKARSVDSEIPVIKDTLLSAKEIKRCLTNLGAKDVKLIIPDEKTLPHLGWDGLIIATGSTFSHIRVLTDAIVSNLRKRNLARKRVIGALYGSEGGQDTSSRKQRRGMPKKMDDGWMCVDCGNFIVHVQDDINRRSIDLEGLWSPGERGKEGRALRNLDVNDEDAVDEYIANNPIPSEYSESLINISGDFWGDRQNLGRIGNIVKGKSGRWTPNTNEKRRPKNRGKW